jgi:small subunit ribosomal protein S9
MIDDERPDAPEEEPTPGGDDPAADAPDPSASADPSESPAAGDEATEGEPPAEETAEQGDAPAGEPTEAAAEEAPDAPAEEPAAEEPPAEEPPAAEEPAPAEEPPAAEAPAADAVPADERPKRDKKKKGDEKAEPEVVPGAHLEPDLVLEPDRPEGELDDDLARYATAEEGEAAVGEAPDAEAGDEVAAQPAPRSALDLAADARYRATGKRKTAVARVILRPGDGGYSVNGRSLEDFFPRAALQKAARQPLEVAGFERRMDVIARIHGGGVSAQAGALRHGVARALVEADPALRPELKRRGLLTRDARAKERKKAGLKKARKRPQFSKR